MRKSTLLFSLLPSFLFLLCACTLSAQSGTVTGNISDKDGPLIGATVELLGEGKGTVTDLDGNFSIELEPGDYTLEASYAGYEAMQKTIRVASGQSRRVSFWAMSW